MSRMRSWRACLGSYLWRPDDSFDDVLYSFTIFLDQITSRDQTKLTIHKRDSLQPYRTGKF